MHSIFQPQKITGVLCPGLGLNGGVGDEGCEGWKGSRTKKKGMDFEYKQMELFVYIYI